MLSVVGKEFGIVVLSQQTLYHNAGFCEVTGRASRVKWIFLAQTLHKRCQGTWMIQINVLITVHFWNSLLTNSSSRPSSTTLHVHPTRFSRSTVTHPPLSVVTSRNWQWGLVLGGGSFTALHLGSSSSWGHCGQNINCYNWSTKWAYHYTLSRTYYSTSCLRTRPRDLEAGSRQ